MSRTSSSISIGKIQYWASNFFQWWPLFVSRNSLNWLGASRRSFMVSAICSPSSRSLIAGRKYLFWIAQIISRSSPTVDSEELRTVWAKYFQHFILALTALKNHNKAKFYRILLPLSTTHRSLVNRRVRLASSVENCFLPLRKLGISARNFSFSIVIFASRNCS